MHSPQSFSILAAEAETDRLTALLASMRKKAAEQYAQIKALEKVERELKRIPAEQLAALGKAVDEQSAELKALDEMAEKYAKLAAQRPVRKY